ncbi:exo-alpha-sialidase [Reichenbachiella ulvae]|uniref:Exo-alpha-sialidase n=1 Tax=Reichenbachiella ulvae TaxID=2980104 RepID=A0ABT3CQS0_9BACT|nr:exo-alpha-sialidase [Reichenbachiella ulvae]MCV9385921.1 exo-alpha-sialidase [Reichenbachiella ulvae]
MKYSCIILSSILSLVLISTCWAQEKLLSHTDDLFNQEQTQDLGLSIVTGAETVTVFSPSDSTDKFSNNVVMIGFQGYLYCQWQSSAVGEDGLDSWVAYSRSKDGVHWSDPMVLAESIEEGYTAPGGWRVHNGELIAYINTWPESTHPRGGYTRYISSQDGIHWSDPRAVTMQNGDTLKAIIEQDPHEVISGRLVNAAHFQPGLIVNPIYTDDPRGVSDWVKADFENVSIDDVSRCIEPSTFIRPDSTLVMIFRDQKSSFVKFASFSKDKGQSWTKPVATSFPDARTKQSAGNIPNGSIYMAGNPVQNKVRIPLVISLSQDGILFDKAFVLRKGGADLQALRTEGKAKRPGYHYPKSMIFEGYLYVSYATNKEDVEFTRIPLSKLMEF